MARWSSASTRNAWTRCWPGKPIHRPRDSAGEPIKAARIGRERSGPDSGRGISLLEELCRSSRSLVPILATTTVPPAATPCGTTPIAATSTTIASATRTGWPFFPWPGFVYCERAPPHVGAAQGGNGRVGLGSIGHLHKPEATRPTGLAIGDDFSRVYRAVRFKGLPQVVRGCGKRQISHVDVLAHTHLPVRYFAPVLNPNTVHTWSLAPRECLGES